MAGARKARKHDSVESVAWVKDPEVDQAAEPGAGEVAAPAEPNDAIGEFLGDTVSPVSGKRSWLQWRQLRWALLLLPILGLGTPLFLWVQYESHHVTSKNAAVRGHLAEIGARLRGQVASVNVEAGDQVSAGQILVQLDDRHLAAAVQEAHAAIAGLEREIEVETLSVQLEARKIIRQGTEADALLTAAQAKTEAARIEFDETVREHELRQSLYERDGAISVEDVRTADSVRRAALARLEEAQANEAAAVSALELAGLAEDERGIRSRKIGVLEADLARARARLMRVEADLDGAAIRAPQDGAILRRIIQPGGSVEVGQPIISMWLGEDVWVEAWIDEEDIGKVKLGVAATVTLHSYPGQEFSGVVDKIGLATDLEMPDSDVPRPRFARMRGAPVVGVRIKLDDPPSDMLPGLSAVVAIEKAG